MRPKRHTKNIKDTQWNTLNKEVINKLNYNKKLMPVARAVSEWCIISKKLSYRGE